MAQSKGKQTIFAIYTGVVIWMTYFKKRVIAQQVWKLFLVHKITFLIISTKSWPTDAALWSKSQHEVKCKDTKVIS